jgi:hypothetical protein
LGWRAVEFSLKSGIRAAFSPAVDEAWVRNFDATVEQVLKAHLKDF